MHAFSAAELISPAIKRTRWFLFQPFRWGTFLKLCLVSVLTEGGGGGFSGNYGFPRGGHSGTSSGQQVLSAPSIHSASFGHSPAWIALFAAVVMVAIGLGFVIFYLVTRLRFALFHCLVYRTREIRPGWRIYDTQSWRFFLLSIAVGLIFFLAVLLIALPFIFGFYRLSQSAHPGVAFNMAGFFSLLLPLIPIMFVVFLMAIAIFVILNDLMLPHIALENASVGDAWRETRLRIASEKGGFLLYTFLRIVLPLAARIAALIVLLIPLIVLIVALALPLAGLMALTAHATGLTHAIMILLIAVIALAGLAFCVLIALCTGGPIGIATRNYALLFYGGRYKVLGDLLDPPPPPAVVGVPGSV